MDIFIYILAIVCALLAIVGSVLPAVPGAAFAYLALWLARWSGMCDFSATYMLVMAAVTFVVFVLDYLIAPLIIRRMGGSRAATWGATIGMIFGIILTPVGMLLGMFLGALLGEYVFNKSGAKRSFRAMVGVFLGFLLGTGLKLILCVYVLIAIIRAACA